MVEQVGGDLLLLEDLHYLTSIHPDFSNKTCNPPKQNRLIMKHLFTLLFPLLSTLAGIAQLTGHFELGLGDQGYQHAKSIKDFSVAAGYSTPKDFFFYGGMSFQTHYWEGSPLLEDDEDEYDEVTSKLYNISFYTGANYPFTLYNIKDGLTFQHFGIYPEFRMYFSPSIPMHFSDYSDDNPDEIITHKGPSKSQLSFGIGGGIYIGNIRDALIALKFEYRTDDTYETLRHMDFPGKEYEFPRRNQYLLSLSIRLRHNKNKRQTKKRERERERERRNYISKFDSYL